MTPPRSSTKIVCECLKVTEAQLLKAIETRQVRGLKDIICYTSAGEGCTACHPLLQEYLERRREKEKASPACPSHPASPESPSMPA